MNTRLLRGTAIVLAFLFFLMVPVPGAFAADDEDSTNTGVLIGVFVVVLGVLAWLGLRSDMERWQSADAQQQPYRYPGEYAENNEVIADGGDALRVESDPMVISADGLRITF